MMFEYFFLGVQQDFKLAILAPIVCAIFRGIFICVYRPKTRLANDRARLVQCFRYGFWWGMDFNAYIFLISMIVITIPASFISTYYVFSDTIRIVLNVLYLIILYTAFMGKMIFYYHFHDIFNPLVKLGKNADKMNFIDIFFNQNHGGFILIGYIPYIIICAFLTSLILSIPSVPYPIFSNQYIQYAFNIFFFVGSIIVFYFFRFGGTLSHRKKPEWDAMPSLVKEDLFLAKATVDDLVALELVIKHPVQEILTHDDETSINIMSSVIPKVKECDFFDLFKHEAQGARITFPKQIFFVVGESYTQSVLDEIFAPLHLADKGKAFRANKHTFTIDNFLPAGLVSQPAITSLLAGVFDNNLEINEKDIFWHHSIPTALPFQLKRLGYKCILWYGGSLSWSSIGNFAKAIGFDEVYGGPDICGKGAPSTWLGVYDHIFLSEVYKRIQAESHLRPVFHFVYTTSNHGPFTIPIEKYGWNPNLVMPDVPKELRENKEKMANMGTYWYTDQSIFDFVENVKENYEDSLIIVTGDHSRRIYDYDGSIMKRTAESLREKYATSFAMYHREFSQEMFYNNPIGGHMNILPTIFEAIAPKNFEYYSLMPSFFDPIDRVVTPYHWMTRDEIGYYGDRIAQELISTGEEIPVQRDRVKFSKERDAFNEITGYILRHPELLIRTI